MNAERPVGERIFPFEDLKLIAFFAVNLIMLSNSCKLIINDVYDMGFFNTPLIGSVTSSISFIVVIFFCLYLDYYRPTVNLTFYYIIITVLAINCFIWEFMFFVNQTGTLLKALVVGITALLLYLICF